MIGRVSIACSAVLAGAALLLSVSTSRADVTLPVGAQVLSVRETPLGTYALPTGPIAADGVPLRPIEGHILRRTWRIPGDATVLQLLVPLRDQLLDGGYDVVFQCEARQCGGFDFRFGIEVVPAPDMAVNISNYHFLSAVRERRAVSLLVSRSGQSAYLQMIEVSPDNQFVLLPEQTAQKPDTATIAEAEMNELGRSLLAQGHAVLKGLDFGSGRVSLERETYPSLSELARFLNANPQYSVVVVGHTDTVGNLEDNRGLSRRRAEAVKAYLVQQEGVPAERIATEGVGYLAPVASNSTAEGREANRRVEVVLISKESR